MALYQSDRTIAFRRAYGKAAPPEKLTQEGFDGNDRPFASLAASQARRTTGCAGPLGILARSPAIPTSKARFSQAAIDAVRQWRFEPFQFDGKPVDVQQTIDVVFSLTK